jgi:thiol-disulfide isomerase/thioredoxin
MSGRTQWFAVGAVVVVIGGGLAFATMGADKAGVVAPGSPAPAFAAQSVPDANAAIVTKGIANYRGKAVLLNIWATWCGPCREEMPRIERLHQELGPQGLAVVAVSIDNPGMADAIRDFRKEMGLSFEILYDESGRIRDDYQTAGVPETFLIDKQGVIRRRLIGASWTVDDQRALLRDLIAEAAR